MPLSPRKEPESRARFEPTGIPAVDRVLQHLADQIERLRDQAAPPISHEDRVQERRLTGVQIHKDRRSDDYTLRLNTPDGVFEMDPARPGYFRSAEDPAVNRPHIPGAASVTMETKNVAFYGTDQHLVSVEARARDPKIQLRWKVLEDGIEITDSMTDPATAEGVLNEGATHFVNQNLVVDKGENPRQLLVYAVNTQTGERSAVETYFIAGTQVPSSGGGGGGGGCVCCLHPATVAAWDMRERASATEVEDLVGDHTVDLQGDLSFTSLGVGVESASTASHGVVQNGGELWNRGEDLKQNGLRRAMTFLFFIGDVPDTDGLDFDFELIRFDFSVASDKVIKIDGSTSQFTLSSTGFPDNLSMFASGIVGRFYAVVVYEVDTVNSGGSPAISFNAVTYMIRVEDQAVRVDHRWEDAQGLPDEEPQEVRLLTTASGKHAEVTWMQIIHSALSWREIRKEFECIQGIMQHRALDQGSGVWSIGELPDRSPPFPLPPGTVFCHAPSTLDLSDTLNPTIDEDAQVPDTLGNLPLGFEWANDASLDLRGILFTDTGGSIDYLVHEAGGELFDASVFSIIWLVGNPGLTGPTNATLQLCDMIGGRRGNWEFARFFVEYDLENQQVGAFLRSDFNNVDVTHVDENSVITGLDRTDPTLIMVRVDPLNKLVDLHTIDATSGYQSGALTWTGTFPSVLPCRWHASDWMSPFNMAGDFYWTFDLGANRLIPPSEFKRLANDLRWWLAESRGIALSELWSTLSI